MNVGRFIDLTCERFADREALVTDDRRLSYRDLNAEINRLAHGVLGLGLAHHDHVGVLLPNSREWMLADLALMKAGLAHVRLHTKLTLEEFDFLINDAGCAAVICDAELGAPLLADRGRFPTVRTWIVVGGDAAGHGPVRSFDTVMASGAPGPVDYRHVGPGTYSNIRYTAGTTGRPKGATFTHAKRIAGIGRFLAESAFAERGPEPPLGLPRRTLSVAPLTHAAATHLYWTFSAGGTNVVPRRQRWDAGWTAVYMEQEAITHVFLVPTMIYDLFRAAPALAHRDRIPLETIVYGASVMPEALLAEARERFGEVMVQLFGLTEADGAFAILHKADHRVAPTSVGRPFATTGFEIQGRDGEVLGPGESGEIVGWGPQLMAGYLNRPDATAATIVDGKIRTGDVGYVDDRGYLYYQERLDDMIVSGGLNVYPREVEDAINGVDGVRECALVSRPHERWGQEIVAVVVPGDGFDEQRVRAELAGKLAGYKRPKQIVTTTELPRSQTGKILRRQVREMVRTPEQVGP